MYIFELIYKIIDTLKNPKPIERADYFEEYQKCDHIFVPVDSTKKILACTKCGIIKKIK
ncbi:MAG: hypothetical protein Q4F80_09435 [bacterium]|nr:hypothetical protein [bacterium]